MRRRIRKYGMAVAQFFIFTVVTGLTLAVYWYYESPPYNLYDRVLLTPRVAPGGMFKLQVKVEWTKTCYSRLFRNIIDSSGHLHPYEREVRPNIKGLKTFTIASQVPKEIAYGPATWEVRTEWFCNPVQWYFPYNDVLDPIPFTIVPEHQVNLRSKP